MNRRDFLRKIGLGAAAMSLPGWAALSREKRGNKMPGKLPNIVFIFADDWGYGDLGIHGSTFCETPNIDRMAKQGIDFQNFTVNSPVCSPSRVAVMTGQFPARHCVHRHFASIKHHESTGMPDWLDPDAPMMTKLLKKQGYVTGHFGKWHLTSRGIKDAPLPTEYGYDEYGAFNVPGEQIKTAATCPLTVDFIRRHKDKPFFINVWLHETHLPHHPQEEFMKKFEHLDEQQQVYAAVVAEADAGVGSIMDELKKHGLDENTLVVFSSDNGPEWTGNASQKKKGAGFGKYYSVGTTGGLKGQKRSLFAGGVRVPFIARWPGVVPAGKTDRSSILNAVDLLPTFTEIAGGKLAQDYEADGESILAALKGSPFKRARPIFWEWRGNHSQPMYLWPHLGVCEGKWKLMTNQELKQTELYNIETDWAEKENLSEKFPEIVKALTEKALAWKKALPQTPPKHCISKLRGR
jgi:arylsulfatase A-like enzyme